MESISTASHQLQQLFAGSPLRYMFTAMAAGSSPARVWVDHGENPSSAFIWDGNHCLYLGGDANNTAFNRELRDLLMDSILPKAQQRHLGVFKLIATHDAWHTRAAALFHPLSLQPRTRVLYRLDSASIVSQPDTLPPDLHLKLIDADLLSDSSRPGIASIIEEIELCWGSVDLFLKHGFGYCVVSDVEGAVGWCTAEFVSPGMCAVGIETLPAYQQRGLATRMAQAFVEHGIRQALQIYWDAWLTNTPSVRVAEKAGFQKVTEYPSHLVILE